MGNRTLSYLIDPAPRGGLSRGMLLDAVEAPYDSASVFAFGNADLFAGSKIDAVVVVLDAAAYRARGPIVRHGRQ